MTKLTGWYSGDQRPVRDGVYQRDFSSVTFYSAFSSGLWCVSSNSLEGAISNSSIFSQAQNLPWRGIQGEEE